MSKPSDNPADPFKKALAEATRTMADDPEMAVTYSVDPSGMNKEGVRLPQVSRRMTRDEVLLARGTADAFALRRKYHDDGVAARYAPTGPLARDPRHGHPYGPKFPSVTVYHFFIGYIKYRPSAQEDSTMNMRWLLIEITETVEELKAIMHSQVKAKLKERIHALYVWKAGIVKNIADLASLLGRSESTIRLWFARYQAEGLSGLLAWNYRGGKRPALSGTLLEALQIRLQEPDGFRSYGEIRDWLAKEQGLEIPYKTVHQTVRYKLKAKLKVARPIHRLRAEMAVVDFKKTPRTA